MDVHVIIFIARVWSVASKPSTGNKMNKWPSLGNRPTTVAYLLGVQLVVLYLSYSQVEAG